MVSPLTSYAEFLNYSRSDTNLNLAPARLVDAMDFRCREMYDKWERAKCESKVEVESRLMVKGQDMTERRGDDGGGGGGGGGCGCLECQRQPNKLKMIIVRIETQNNKHKLICGPNKRITYFAESTNNDKSNNSSNEGIEFVTDVGNVCLLCRQRVVGPCMNCWEHYAAATKCADDKNNANSSNSNNSSSSSNSRKCNSSSGGGNNKRSSHRRVCSIVCKRRKSDSDVAGVNSSWSWSYNSHRSRSNSSRSSSAESNYQVQHANAAAATTSAREKVEQFRLRTDCRISAASGDWPTRKEVATTPPTRATTRSFSVNELLPKGPLRAHNYNSHNHNYSSSPSSSCNVVSNNNSNNDNNDNIHYIHHNHDKKQHSKHRTPHHYCKHSSTSAAGTNSSYTFEQRDHITPTPTTPAPTTTVATNPTASETNGESVSAWGSPFASTLGTLQFLMIYTQMQLLRPLWKKFNNVCVGLRTQATATKCKFNKRQQRPPHKRLMKIRCNSYYDNATSNNSFNNNNNNNNNHNHHNNNNSNSNNNINNNNNTSHKQQSLLQQLLQPLIQQFHIQAVQQQYRIDDKRLAQKSHQHYRRHQHQQQQQQHHHRLGLTAPSQQEQQQLLQQYLRYFKMPNLSRLYKILIVLSFLSLFLPSTNAQASPALQTQLSATTTTTTTTSANKPKVILARNETVCRSMDLRNTPNEIRQLENCTVIEGFLLISLMNTHSTHTFNESFPLLTEVTEFVVIYRVYNLRTLAEIFPNLSIIRGRILFEGYALVVYSNPHLEELGLTKLTTIKRGGIRIENNINLCYVHTIDWSQIVSNVTDITIVKNRNPIECSKCPGDTKNDGNTDSGGLVCKESDGLRRCWNDKSCQKICPEKCRNNCIDENTCCNEACISGCSPTNLNACNICRHFSIFNSTCIDECPPNYFVYLDRRCITAEQCLAIGTKFENNKSEKIVPYNGTCLSQCPIGYNKVDLTCKKCNGKCVKKCVGGQIESVERAKEYQGCTHIITNGLVINIKRGGRHLMEELQHGLSSIQEISTFLKVQGTYGILSLSFFQNLKVIHGEKLMDNEYALYVLENYDLETIWGPNKTVEINNGRVFFHFNPKLCFSEIENLRKHMRLNQPFTKNEVARDSNGHKGSCNLELLNITITKITHRGAVVTILNPVNFPDERSFIGYQYLYMEDKYKNATKYSQGTCYDTWTVSDPSKEDTYMFFNLQPFTQYAVYVKTWTISSEPLNAQSEIQYFKTKSAQPQYVQTLNAYAKSSSEIVLTWTPPLNPHGNLIVYRVSAILDQRSQVVESRNYCKDPAQIDKEEDAKDMSRDTQVAVTDQPPNDSDCKCSKEPSSNHTEIDTKESIITDRIDFENTLQNFIYVKHTKDKNSSRLTDEDTGASLTDMDAERRRRRRHSEGDPLDSFLIRHMRAIPDDLEHKLLNNIDKLSGDNSGDNSITTIAPLEDSTNTSINDTRKDPTGKYYESFVFNVSVTTNKFVFTQLRHFSFYKVGVEACREREEGATKKECSDMRIQFVRTKKLDIVDKIQNLRAELDHTNTSRQSVRLYWDPPEEPNGAVVSYTISYIRDTTDAVEEKKCITDIDYRNLTNGYMLSGLHAGNYSIRIRANSLAGDGIYSEPVTVVIPPTQMSTMLIVILCVVGVVLVVGGGIVVYMLCKKMAPPSDLKIFPTVNPYYISLQYIPDEWEVARERVIQLSPLGQGSFGMVYEGILKGYNNSTEDTPCAIKTVNENATDRERMNFLNEASVMKQFDTYHVVRLLGVCSVGQPALVVMELMKHGDLKSYLRAHRPDERDGEGSMAFMRGEAVPMQAPPLSRIYQMAIEIADGMAYLAAKKFVHRDLAARNCMVAADLTVKIGDFGMTRDIYETDYYRKGTKGLLPVRWMPPESLRDGVYSTASDVFSYGVVLWEMVTLASQPYPGYSNDQVLRFVIEGGVMERPENCPDKIYELMQQCWEHRPSKRPSFLKIIRALLDLSEPHFREVSFYHSEEGQIEREKERTESNQNSGDVFNDENEMDDVTTPLRMGEYNDYKLNMGNNSSVENAGDSPMAIDDDQPHSPYSLASIIGSTPDGQSKNSFNLSQMSHNNPTLLSSVPSTSAGIISGGSHSHSHSQPHSQQRFPPHNQYSRQQNDQCAAYVQPDYDPNEDQAGATGQSVETDERGYELYDPSPNYREHAPYDPADDEEDFDGIGLSGRSGRQSGGQNLLPRHKAHQRAPIIMPMSSSMPDEIINAPPSSSLHPSTASAASSNASSTATTTGRYQILAKVLAETARLRNRRFFNHKRSGSNVSHKSTSSNPNTASYNSASNLTGATSGRDKSMSGQNLGTIESSGSGSAGSYAPRFFSPTSTTSTTLTTENPNYKLLDETANASCISAAGESATTSTPKKCTTTTKSQKPSSTAGYTTSANPNYQLLDETLNVTMTPTKPPTAATQAPKSAPSNASYVGMLHTSENPNYEPMESPTQRSDNKPDYVMMMLDEPTYSMPHPQSLKSSNNSISFAHMSENPNYQMMGPQHSGHGTPVSSDDDCEPNEDDDDGGQLMGHIKMERIPLSRRRSNDRAQEQLKSRASRSRSQSQNKADEKAKTQSPTNTTSSYTSLSTTATTTAPSLTTASSGTTLATQSRPSTTYSLKEKWLRQQQAQPPPPPPNGFIGPEA